MENLTLTPEAIKYLIGKTIYSADGESITLSDGRRIYLEQDEIDTLNDSIDDSEEQSFPYKVIVDGECVAEISTLSDAYECASEYNGKATIVF